MDNPSPDPQGGRRNLHFLDSASDPRLEVYRDLRRSPLAAASGKFIAEGRWLVQRLLNSDCEVESLLLTAGRLPDLAPLAPASVPIFVLPQAAVAGLLGFDFHRGVMACAVRPPIGDLQALPLERSPVLLAVVAGVQDAENLGGIFRSCAAFGVAGVLLGPATADPLSRRVLRVSMGHVLRTPLAQTADLAADLRSLAAAGFDVAATVVDETATAIQEFQPRRRQAIVFGQEAFGLDPATVAACSSRLTIPMAAGADSLNVSVAAGIFLHHLSARLRERR
jgi:tRNA G18 (ribose-2'-O)-methylase SpoU